MEIIGLILGILGLFGWPLIVWFFGHYLISAYYVHFGSEAQICHFLERIVKKHTFPYSQKEAGTYKSIQVEWFIDFLSAVCDSKDLLLLDRSLARWIQIKQLKPSRIVVPKLGNVVLASTIARRLELPLVIAYQPIQGSLNTRAFDGAIYRGENVLIVDDVASDCNFLMQVVERLRKQDVNLIGLVVLVGRIEGGFREVIQGENIPYFPILEFDDAKLAKLLEVQVTPDKIPDKLEGSA